MKKILLILFTSVLTSYATPSLPNFSQTTVVSGLSNPTSMSFAPDGRLFICFQNGQVRIIKNGVLLPTPFLSISVQNIGERGLLGIAIDPDFANNNYVYVYYTTPNTPIYNRISRFQANGDIGGNETVLLNLNNLSSASNHNGGALHFGNDQKLYIGVGDNAYSPNSQTLTNYLGKILRINKDGTLPSDNPFANNPNIAAKAIYCYGLRNPFTMGFSQLGDFFINDVGQNAWEEINVGAPGANFGWPSCEGVCSTPGFANPIETYHHINGSYTGSTIAGGVFYDGAIYPTNMRYGYFYADYVDDWIRIRNQDGSIQLFATSVLSPVDLDVGLDGKIYCLTRSSLIRFDHSAVVSLPVITQHPVQQNIQVGGTATFSVTASGATSYQWRRNTANITGATNSIYIKNNVPQSDHWATFRCVVSNSAGSVTSNPATLLIVTNSPPTIFIDNPITGTKYAALDNITYSATANDPEDGALTNIVWTVVFHHDTHAHPFVGPITNKTGSFVIPDEGEVAATVWYRLHATTTDSKGASVTTYRDLLPRVVTITLNSNPNGLKVLLDGQPVTTPFINQSVAGNKRLLGVLMPQTLSGQSFTFGDWSDTLPATHYVLPQSNTTYTATFNPEEDKFLSVTKLPNDMVSLEILTHISNILVFQENGTNKGVFIFPWRSTNVTVTPLE